MVNFVNPGVLGNIETFRNTFQTPIETSRLPDAIPEERELGRQRSIEVCNKAFANQNRKAQFLLGRPAAEIL